MSWQTIGVLANPRWSDAEKKYRMDLAQDRDNRLNKEEELVYHDTQIELEYGVGFFLRAHP